MVDRVICTGGRPGGEPGEGPERSAVGVDVQGGVILIVRALIVQSGQVLFTKTTEDDANFSPHYHFLPGGHVNYNEPCLVALRREIFEEMSMSIDSAEFAGVLECYWERHGVGYHEIIILYLVNMQGLDVNSPPKSMEAHQKFVWVPFERLSTIDLLPETLGEFIHNITNGPRKVAFYSEMGGG